MDHHFVGETMDHHVVLCTCTLLQASKADLGKRGNKEARVYKGWLQFSASSAKVERAIQIMKSEIQRDIAKNIDPQLNLISM